MQRIQAQRSKHTSSLLAQEPSAGSRHFNTYNSYWEMLSLALAFTSAYQERNNQILINPSSIVVVLSGPRKSTYPQGVLVGCVVTEQRKDYTEITCADWTMDNSLREKSPDGHLQMKLHGSILRPSLFPLATTPLMEDSRYFRFKWTPALRPVVVKNKLRKTLINSPSRAYSG